MRMHIDRSRFLLLAGAIATSAAALVPLDDVVAAQSGHGDAEPLGDQSCQNADGAPPQCSLRAPGPQCESFADTKKECPVVRGLLDARVAEPFVRCLNRKSGTQAICDFESASSCFADAIKVACIEPDTEPSCRKLVRECNDTMRGQHELTLTGCQRLLSATSKSQHRRLVTSMSESCSARIGYWDLSMAAHDS